MDHRCGASAWILIAVVFALPAVAASYNVLFLMPLGGRSHKNALYPIAEELGKKGHQVTFFSWLPEKTETKGVRDVVMSPANVIQTFLGNFSFFNDQIMTWQFMKKAHSMVSQLIKEFYTDGFVQDLILNPRVNGSSLRYDVVIVNALMNEFALPLVHHLGAAVIYVSPTVLPSTITWSMNIPVPPYVPSLLFLKADATVSFFERALTSITNFAFVLVRTYLQLPSYDEDIREFLPDAPSIIDIERNISFLLSNTHFSFNLISPSMPYHADVGALHCRPAIKLPKDLEDFMQSSGDYGVIYFSFGSVQKGSGVPESMKQKFITVFSELPQKVIWKHEDTIKDLPKNVKLIDWAPQQDILGHSKVRLFISHAGGLSIHETCYHGTPILAFPLGGDQASNAGNAFRLGLAEYLDWQTFSIEDLRDKIKRLLEDPKYTENAKKTSELFRDRPERPAELAAYWVEYVARHKGAHHLKSGAENLNFFQYFLLDVISAIVIVIAIVVGLVTFIAVFIVRKIMSWLSWRSGSSRNRNKHQTNNKDKVKKN